MFLYYFGITLDFAGSSDSRYVLAIVTFIWCLKFYQFLRAFESVGTYIIMVQKMVCITLNKIHFVIWASLS